MSDINDYQAASELLRALSAPMRVAIVTELASGPKCVHEMVESLRVLRAARVVAGQRRGREIAYALTDDHIAHIVADAIHHAGEAQR